MVNYECPRCGYSSVYKNDIKRHFDRKILCKPLIDDIVLSNDIKNNILNRQQTLECPNCNKSYTRKTNLNKHMKKCELKKEEVEDQDSLRSLLQLVDKLNKKIDKQDQDAENQKQEMQELKNMVKKAGLSPTTINNQYNTVNIVLPYKKTDVSHLKDQDYYRSVSKCIMGIPHLISKTHFNPKKPENHNIYIKNISKKEYAMMWDGDQWIVKDQDEAIDDLIRENEYRLEEWVEDGSEKYPTAMEKFKEYVSIRDEKGVPETIKEEVRRLLYNNRKMVKMLLDK